MKGVNGSTGFKAHLSGDADFRGNYLYFKKNGMFWSSAQTSEERAYHVGINDKNTWNKFVARKLEPTKLTMQTIGEWLRDTRNTTPLGYVGDPASYDAKEAKTFWDAMCKMAADAIEEYVKNKQQYRMPENQVLKYQTSMDQTQNLDIMGQFVETETSSFSGFSVKSKGSLDGKGEQMGTDLTSEGEIEGSDTLYFTYKKGIFVKETVDILTEATVAASGAQNMRIPMTQEMKIETKLIE